MNPESGSHSYSDVESYIEDGGGVVNVGPPLQDGIHIVRLDGVMDGPPIQGQEDGHIVDTESHNHIIQMSSYADIEDGVVDGPSIQEQGDDHMMDSVLHDENLDLEDGLNVAESGVEINRVVSQVNVDSGEEINHVGSQDVIIGPVQAMDEL